MFCRHVDFFAVLFITLGLLAFSQASQIVVPVAVRPVGFEQPVLKAQSCPLAQQIRLQIDSLRNR
ncbi:MAG: hypothetical protein LAP38_06745 [Acidobacteriia bacterium]|nr:hypothetical protein [Terriglobia bacterium]